MDTVDNSLGIFLTDIHGYLQGFDSSMGATPNMKLPLAGEHSPRNQAYDVSASVYQQTALAEDPLLVCTHTERLCLYR